MHKMLVFDLDQTLCPVGAPITKENITKLCMLEEKGYVITICSGKPAYYLFGFLRQVGLKAPIVAAENGAVIHFGIDIPPKKLLYQPYSEQAKVQLTALKKEIQAVCGDGVWFQPNEIELTPFFSSPTACRQIDQIINSGKLTLDELEIYVHHDCYDFVPSNISKAGGLAILAQETNTTNSEFIAVGDGVNDISMFEFADVSILIGELEYDSDYRFSTIDDALDFLLNQSGRLE